MELIREEIIGDKIIREYGIDGEVKFKVEALYTEPGNTNIPVPPNPLDALRQDNEQLKTDMVAMQDAINMLLGV